jgi:phosphoserine phosphatase
VARIRRGRDQVLSAWRISHHTARTASPLRNWATARAERTRTQCALPYWLLRGKAYLKECIAREVDVDAALLPYHKGLLARLGELHASGRRLVLTTASHRKYAEKVAAHLRIFDEILTTEGAYNLSGAAKRAVLVERFGRRGFDYAGSGRRDLAIWTDAAEAVVVNPERGVRAKVERIGIPTSCLDDRRATVESLAEALRLHQWLKNLLLLVPLAAAHKAGDVQLILQAVIAFLAFGVTA